MQMTLRAWWALGLAAVVAFTSADALSSSAAAPTSVGKVVQMLEQMKAQVEKESDADAAAYDKYACWCKHGKEEKTEAIEVAEARITEATAALEKAAGLEAELKTENEQLVADIADDEQSLEEATALRAKENEEFKAQEADMSETSMLLGQALEVLAKVQLLQKTKKGAAQDAKPLLLQLKGKVELLKPNLAKYRSVMQQDLWDMMSSLDTAFGNDGKFLQPSAAATALAQQPQISEEEQGKMDKPNDLVGAASGAKSYNSRSGRIYGMLAEMRDEFDRDLAEARKAEETAEAEFQKLKAAKLAEIAAATAQKKQNEKTLADTLAEAAETKRDMEKTQDALAADEKVLLNLEENCKQEEEAYAARKKDRSEELQALSEAISILTADDARALFDKSVTKELSFLQLGNGRRQKMVEATQAAQRKVVNRAVQHVLHEARRHKDWSLASLAVRMSLDPFTKVKEAMDKMIAELKSQQAEESKKWEFCKASIDTTEDHLKEKNIEKKDLEEKKLGLENAISKLEADIAVLNQEVSEMQISLKAAGEDRKAENLVFQQAVSEQRETAAILKKALTRLEAFYLPNATSLSQASAEPGAALATPPPKPSDYRKSEGAGGVLQLMSQILSDVARTEAELKIDEQHAQDAYASFAADTTASIEAKRQSVTEKTKLKEERSSDLSNTNGALLSNGEEIESLEETLGGLHTDCDFLLKYYEVRQKARSEEMGAIAEAKAILSGAGLDEAEEAGEAAEGF